MPMQIRRTLTPDLPPTALAEGQLSIEMASTPPKLWCGVPTAIDASGRVLLTPDPPGLFTPTVPGIVPASGGGTANYLRADGSWAAPPAPAAKQGDVRFDSGKLEQFDGTAWQEIQIAGWPAEGVTDGSNATPGDVGECITQYSGVIGLPYNTFNVYGTVTTLPLAAGDWDVAGHGRFYSMAYNVADQLVALRSIRLQFDGSENNAGFVYYEGETAGFTSFPVSPGPLRYSLSASATVSVMSRGTFVAGGNPVTGVVRVELWLLARRMR